MIHSFRGSQVPIADYYVFTTLHKPKESISIKIFCSLRYPPSKKGRARVREGWLCLKRGVALLCSQRYRPPPLRGGVMELDLGKAEVWFSESSPFSLWSLD